MTKADIIQCVHQKHGGLTKDEARELVNLIITILKKALLRDDTITLSLLGTFKLIERAARKGRNPQTGERMMIPAHRSVIWKHSARLEDRLNSN